MQTQRVLSVASDVQNGTQGQGGPNPPVLRIGGAHHLGAGRNMAETPHISAVVVSLRVGRPRAPRWSGWAAAVAGVQPSTGGMRIDSLHVGKWIP